MGGSQDERGEERERTEKENPQTKEEERKKEKPPPTKEGKKKEKGKPQDEGGGGEGEGEIFDILKHQKDSAPHTCGTTSQATHTHTQKKATRSSQLIYYLLAQNIWLVRTFACSYT